MSFLTRRPQAHICVRTMPFHSLRNRWRTGAVSAWIPALYGSCAVGPDTRRKALDDFAQISRSPNPKIKAAARG